MTPIIAFGPPCDFTAPLFFRNARTVRRYNYNKIISKHHLLSTQNYSACNERPSKDDLICLLSWRHMAWTCQKTVSFHSYCVGYDTPQSSLGSTVRRLLVFTAHSVRHSRLSTPPSPKLCLLSTQTLQRTIHNGMTTLSKCVSSRRSTPRRCLPRRH